MPKTIKVRKKYIFRLFTFMTRCHLYIYFLKALVLGHKTFKVQFM